MEDINSILSKVGLKCTKQRISVMQVLSDADAPLTVENIYDKVDGMSLSTVYRIAEKLCEKGIVSKHTIQDSDKFYYELINGEHRHYAICLGCKEMRSSNLTAYQCSFSLPMVCLIQSTVKSTAILTALPISKPLTNAPHKVLEKISPVLWK